MENWKQMTAKVKRHKRQYIALNSTPQETFLCSLTIITVDGRPSRPLSNPLLRHPGTELSTYFPSLPWQRREKRFGKFNYFIGVGIWWVWRGSGCGAWRRTGRGEEITSRRAKLAPGTGNRERLRTFIWSKWWGGRPLVCYCTNIIFNDYHVIRMLLWVYAGTHQAMRQRESWWLHV